MTKKDAKVIFLGNSSVGKTSLVGMQHTKTFDGSSSTTLGVSYVINTIQINNDYVKCQVWDTAGEERFRSLIPMYIRGSKAAFVVYDITNKSSFDRIPKWVEGMVVSKEIRVASDWDTVRDLLPDPIEIVILGNKNDLTKHRVVSLTDGQELADRLNCKFFETSAKTAYGINDAFLYVAQKLLLTCRPTINQEAIILKEMETTKKRKCCRK